MRWLIVRSDELKRLRADNIDLLAERKKMQRALAKIGHARDKAYRDAAQVLADLRVLRVQLDHTPYKSFGEGPLRVYFEIADAVIFDAYRRNGTFKEIVGYYIEDAFMRDPAGRAALFNKPPDPKEVPDGR